MILLDVSLEYRVQKALKNDTKKKNIKIAFFS